MINFNQKDSYGIEWDLIDDKSNMWLGRIRIEDDGVNFYPDDENYPLDDMISITKFMKVLQSKKENNEKI